MTMRKLKLQVQMTVDGFVAGPEGQLDSSGAVNRYQPARNASAA